MIFDPPWDLYVWTYVGGQRVPVTHTGKIYVPLSSTATSSEVLRIPLPPDVERERKRREQRASSMVDPRMRRKAKR